MDNDDLDKPGADNAAMAPYWQKVECIIAGIDRLRDEGERFLPKFPDESDKDYKFRLSVSDLTNVFRDIVENLSAKPFSEPVTLRNDPVPKQIETFLDDVDGSGNDFTVFAVDTFFNGIANAIDWIFIDYTEPVAPGVVQSVADEKARGARPYWTHIKACNVLEVRSKIILGKETIIYVRLLEPAIDGGLDHVRVMQALDGFATWQLYEIRETRENITDARIVLVKEGTFTIGIIPMVPFVTGRRAGRSWRFNPPLRDAADLQITVYQDESALSYRSMMTAFPMLAGTGVKLPKTPGSPAQGGGMDVRLAVGPHTVLITPPAGQGETAGEFKWLEPAATSLSFLMTKLEKKILQLRELGRQPLTAQSGNITVISAAVAAEKGNSAVQMWAHGEENALENAILITCLWFKLADFDPDVNVYTDFGVDGSGDDKPTLTEMRKNGDLSQTTYWKELKRRGVLSAEFDEELELEQLLEETANQSEVGANLPEIDPATGLPYPVDPATGLPIKPPPMVAPPVA